MCYFDRLCNGASSGTFPNEEDLREAFPELIARLLLAMYTGKLDNREDSRDLLTSSIGACAKTHETFLGKKRLVVCMPVYMHWG